MFEQVSAMLYAYIVKCEVFMLRQYKVNPFEIMKDISLLDLQTYMKMIEEEEKKEYESVKKKDIMTALKHICEVLNFVFHVK